MPPAISEVVVFGYDRFTTMTTSQLLGRAGIAHTVLCHTADQRRRFLAGGRVAGDLVVTGCPRGLAYQRNAALDRLAPGQWALWLVDDLVRVEQLADYDTWADVGRVPVTPANSALWRRRFGTPLGMRGFMARCGQLVAEAERRRAWLVGFAGYDNPLFRARHWKLNCLADGRAWLVRAGRLRFDEHVQMVDDVCWTAQNLLAYGTVLVDAWLLPRCGRYTGGGFGSITDRLPQKRREVAYLAATYPEVCAVRRKPGWPDGTHVVIRTLPRSWAHSPQRAAARRRLRPPVRAAAPPVAQRGR